MPLFVARGLRQPPTATMAALSSRVKGLKVCASKGLTCRSRASPVSPSPAPPPRTAPPPRAFPPPLTPPRSPPPVTRRYQFMQRAKERDTLAKATANAEAQTEAKKAAERWVAVPKEASVEASDDDEKKLLREAPAAATATREDGDAARETAGPANPPSSCAVTYAPRSSFFAREAPARVSFGGHNEATEAMNAERRERRRAARAAVAARRARPDDVSDAEMAAALAKKKKKKKRSET